MNQPFAAMLAEDGKKNSLGRANEVVEIVLNDPSRLNELYQTSFEADAWVRMRAIDAFEKICRVHPNWIKPYIDKIQAELSNSPQSSIQWHIAQIYTQVELTQSQRNYAINWLKTILASKEADWIVAANAMDALAHFTRQGFAYKSDLQAALAVQKDHKSNAVVKRANILLLEFA